MASVFMVDLEMIKILAPASHVLLRLNNKFLLYEYIYIYIEINNIDASFI